MNRMGIIGCAVVTLLLFLLSSAFVHAAEAVKIKPRDAKTLRLPGKSTQSTTQQTQSPAPAYPEVTSVEILPPTTDCFMRWRLTVKNKGNAPYTNPITVKVSEIKGASTYAAAGGVVSPSPIGAGQSAQAEGKFYAPEKYVSYRLQVMIDNQVVSTQTGQFPSLSHSMSVEGLRFESGRCYATMRNNNAHRECGMLVKSEFATNADPTAWTLGLAFGDKELPPNGTIEQGFLILPDYNLIKVSIQKGSTVFSDKSTTIP